MSSTGNLKIHCFIEHTYLPVADVEIKIFNCDRKLNTLDQIKVVKTNKSGFVSGISLDTPDSCNLKDGELPYGLYNLELSKEGFKDLVVRGVQVFEGKLAIQRCYLEKGDKNHACNTQTVVIPEHKQVLQKCSKSQAKVEPKQKTKINKAKTKTNTNININKKGPIKSTENNLDKPQGPIVFVLEEVEVPSVITVHVGSPTNQLAPNYTVNFVDYIKNVASSELYSTWDADALRANIYCIISFALNRVYTEWYPSQGYNFDVTNDTAYDQAFVYGRTTYNSINVIVDQLFSTFIQIQGTNYPFLAQFCNGTTSVCPGWLSQTGSQSLAQNGYTPYEILTYYYGSDINLVNAPIINGYPASFPGYPITLWMEGEAVKTIQSQLNTIANSYPLIPTLATDGIFGPLTQNSVKVFQSIFDLPETGIVNNATWYSISRVYVGVTNIAN